MPIPGRQVSADVSIGAMDYATVKLIHISAVTVSFLGFAARGVGVLRGAAWVRHRLTRTLPHVIDTILLLSAFGMLWIIRLSPWALPWLRAKLVGLVVYIALGVLAFRSARAGKAGAVSLVAWIGALVVFGYIVSVALTKSPRGVLLWLPPAAPGAL
jgi:uncharacterized membrane protein SirB2